MATAPVRSGVSSRSRGPETFETGLHADADFGAIDVGLAVDHGSFGVVIDAPVVGQLQVAFDVAADGSTRVSSLTRKNVEGLEMRVVLVDESQTQALQAELTTLRQTLDASQHTSTQNEAQLVAQRDQARVETARAHAEIEQHLAALEQARVTAEDRSRSFEADLATAKGDSVAETSRLEAEMAKARAEADAHMRRFEVELKLAQAAAQTEKDARISCMGERETVRAELDRLRGELDAGSATLMREVNEARAARDSSEAERGRLSTDLTELSSALEKRRGELSEAKAELERLGSQLEQARSGHESDRGQMAADADSLRATKTELEQALADEQAAARSTQERLETALAEAQETARSTRERLEGDLDDTRAQLDADRTAAEQSRLELRDALAAKDQALAATAAERHRLVEAHAEALLTAQSAQESLRAALAAAESDQAQLASELEQLRAAWVDRETATTSESEALRGQLSTAQTHLEAREDAFAHAVEQRDGAAHERDLFREQLEQLTNQLQTLQGSYEVQQQATAEARMVAAQHENTLATLLAERDEARNVARGLHQKIAGGAGVEALKTELASTRAALDAERISSTTVVAERDRAQLQVEALGRQLDQERSARAKATLERDQYRDRFRVLTSAQEITGERPKPNITGGPPTGEVTTDVTVLPSDFNKKKEP